MKKAFIIPFIFLIASATLLILIILSRVFFSIPWINIIYDFIRPWLALIFYQYNIYVYGGIILCFVALLPLFVLGYNIAKSNQLTGSIIYIFSLLGYVIIILLASIYTYFSILFNQDLTINTRLMLFLLFLPVNFAITLILFLVNIDFYLFLKDLIKSRKVWKHNRPKFDIKEKGKMTYINIETDEFIFTPVPMLIIAKHLQQKRYSIAWFVKGAFNHLFSLIISYLIGWPTARNMLFRFLGMKIGKNCHISQKAIPDPLLPDLIEFEDGSGCGIGVKLLTHNAMNIKHGSFSFGPIKVCENARIGAYSIILPGVTIGKGSIIGAHSVVAEDIPPYCIALGSPAKVVRELTDPEKEEVNKTY
ncbi:MAG: acyltransferase [Candidatus Heimdallarchaeota archaeon]